MTIHGFHRVQSPAGTIHGLSFLHWAQASAGTIHGLSGVHWAQAPAGTIHGLSGVHRAQTPAGTIHGLRSNKGLLATSKLHLNLLSAEACAAYKMYSKFDDKLAKE